MQPASRYETLPGHTGQCLNVARSRIASPGFCSIRSQSDLQRISMKRWPDSISRSTSGSSGKNHSRRARFEQLPMRSQTTTGACRAWWMRTAKSSSLVSMQAACANAHCHMGESSASRKPISATCSAGCPCSRNQTAKAGGSWASTMNFILTSQLQRGWRDPIPERHV